MPRTENVWVCSDRPPYWTPLEQEVNGAPSSEHSYVVPCMFDEKLNFADVVVVNEPSVGVFWFVPMITAGPVVLTVHEYWAAPEAFPAGSVATTENACGPLPRPEYGFGLEQDAGVPSSVHENVAVASDSFHAKVTEGPLGSDGVWVNDGVPGGVVSTVQAREAGVPSVFPAASTAFTVRV